MRSLRPLISALTLIIALLVGPVQAAPLAQTPAL
jgi:hypothetical protein